MKLVPRFKDDDSMGLFLGLLFWAILLAVAAII